MLFFTAVTDVVQAAHTYKVPSNTAKHCVWYPPQLGLDSRTAIDVYNRMFFAGNIYSNIFMQISQLPQRQ